MVPAEIRKYGDFEIQACDTFHLDRMRRNLHHRMLPSRIDHLTEQLFQIRRFRRRSFRSEIESGPRYSIVPSTAAGLSAAFKMDSTM